jgi:putative methionine-R-sulfoxide reductase with GAF domain
MNLTSNAGHSAVGAAPAPRPAVPWYQSPNLDRDEASVSLSEMADRDLEATLQLLAERARYLTGASNVTIALLELDEFVCRATAGHAGPQIGLAIESTSGFVSRCVSNQQIVVFDGGALDPGIAGTSVSSSTIRSSVAFPLIDEDTVAGLLYLTADRAHAFEEQDIAALTPLSEAIVTSVAHANAARRALSEIASAKVSEPPAVEGPSKPAQVATPASPPPVYPSEPHVAAAVRINHCQGCGFPVSEGRIWCLDCDEAGHTEGLDAPAFFPAGSLDQGWLQTHLYTLGTLLMICLTAVVLMLKFR